MSLLLYNDTSSPCQYSSKHCTVFLPRFPAELFGVLYGTMLVVSAAVGCLQYALFIWSEHSQDAILQVSDRLSVIPPSLCLCGWQFVCCVMPFQVKYLLMFFVPTSEHSVDVSCSYMWTICWCFLFLQLNITLMFLSVLVNVAPLIFVPNSRSKCSVLRCSYRFLVLRLNITLMFLVPTCECYAYVFCFYKWTLRWRSYKRTLRWCFLFPRVNIALMFLVPHWWTLRWCFLFLQVNITLNFPTNEHYADVSCSHGWILRWCLLFLQSEHYADVFTLTFLQANIILMFLVPTGEHYADVSCPLQVNILLLCMSAVTFLHPLYILWKCRRSGTSPSQPA